MERNHSHSSPKGQLASDVMSLEMTLTAVYLEVPEGYIAFLEELPGANTQGRTLEETRQNLREAVDLIVETNRELAEESLGEEEVIREVFHLVAE